MKYSDLARRVLFAPMQLGADRLCILSGYATPNMASWLIKNLKKFKSRPIDLSLIVGMVPFDGLSISVHEGFKELQKELLPYEVVHYQCSYVYGSTPVHAKVYIWLKGDEPVMAFTGSANFTQSAFGDNRREYMVECDALKAYRYYCDIENDTIFCNHAEVEEYIVLYPTQSVLDMENKPI